MSRRNLLQALMMCCVLMTPRVGAIASAGASTAGLMRAAAPSLAGPAGFPGTPRLNLEPCKLPGFDGKALCGRYEVWENRETRKGRKISLRVVVVPATSQNHLPDPVVYFAGGPGSAASEEGLWIVQEFPKFHEKRDIVLVDVRGTGGSHSLRLTGRTGPRSVQAFLDDFMPVDEVRACRAQHADSTDFSQYTTAISMDDVSDVLKALGYSKVNLMGASYGTRSALVFMRRHPGLVRSALLMGVAPTDSRLPITFARDSQDALDGLLAECARDSGCSTAFPHVREEFSSVLKRLDAKPAEVSIRNASTGDPVNLKLTRNGFAQTIRYMLYSPSASALIPLYIHLADAGNFKPIAETAASFAAGLTGMMSDGFYLCVTCAEDVAWIKPDEIKKAVEGTFIGDFRIRKQMAACAEWPVRKVSSDELNPVKSSAPVLIVTGERDPVTPRRWGDEVSRYLANSRHLVISDGGHSLNGLKGIECLDRLMEEFVEKGSVAGLDASCLNNVVRPAFLLSMPADEGITLSEEELAVFVGTYAAKEGFSVNIELSGGNLKMGAPGGPMVILNPVSKTKFKLEGMPPGNGVTFVLTGDKVSGLVLLEEGTAYEMARK